MSDSELIRPTGSNPRVEAELKEWMRQDGRGLCFGTDEEKAACWQKGASRLERLARQLEAELSIANAQGESRR